MCEILKVPVFGPSLLYPKQKFRPPKRRVFHSTERNQPLNRLCVGFMDHAKPSGLIIDSVILLREKSTHFMNLGVLCASPVDDYNSFEHASYRNNKHACIQNLHWHYASAV